MLDQEDVPIIIDYDFIVRHRSARVDGWFDHWDVGAEEG